MAQVDDPQVRIEAGSDIALAWQTESPGDVARRDGRDHIQIEVRLCKQQLPGGLTARDAAPDLSEVVALLEVERARRVIGHDDLDLAGSDHGHQVIAVAGAAEGGRAFADPAQSFKVIVRVEEVVRTGLAADVDAAKLRVLDHRCAPNGADVHDVKPAPGLTRQRDYVLNRG